MCLLLNRLQREKNLSSRLANNKGTDQPAHARSLISAFLFRLLKSVISTHATNDYNSLASLGS